MSRPIRLATRAIILHDSRLLLVNAWPEGVSDLWGAPGGGAEAHHSLPENLRREVQEETGLSIAVGPLALVNEFQDSGHDYHQVDLFFRCTITAGHLEPGHVDPAGVVTRCRFFSREELAGIRFKPDSLPGVAFDRTDAPARYDPLEEVVR